MVFLRISKNIERKAPRCRACDQKHHGHPWSKYALLSLKREDGNPRIRRGWCTRRNPSSGGMTLAHQSHATWQWRKKPMIQTRDANWLSPCFLQATRTYPMEWCNVPIMTICCICPYYLWLNRISDLRIEYRWAVSIASSGNLFLFPISSICGECHSKRMIAMNGMTKYKNVSLATIFHSESFRCKSNPLNPIFLC